MDTGNERLAESVRALVRRGMPRAEAGMAVLERKEALLTAESPEAVASILEEVAPRSDLAGIRRREVEIARREIYQRL